MLYCRRGSRHASTGCLLMVKAASRLETHVALTMNANVAPPSTAYATVRASRGRSAGTAGLSREK